LLSRMHDIPSDNRKFGFPVQTMCRPPLEFNDDAELWSETWEEYFKNAMMMGMINKLEKNLRVEDVESVNMAREVREHIVPKLLGNLNNVKPVLIHGDLCEYC